MRTGVYYKVQKDTHGALVTGWIIKTVVFDVPPCHYECKRRAHLTHMGDHVWTMFVVTRFSGVRVGAYAFLIRKWFSMYRHATMNAKGVFI